MKIHLTAALPLFGWSMLSKFVFQAFQAGYILCIIYLAFLIPPCGKVCPKLIFFFIVTILRTLQSIQIPNIDVSMLQVRPPVFITIVRTV